MDTTRADRGRNSDLASPPVDRHTELARTEASRTSKNHSTPATDTGPLLPTRIGPYAQNVLSNCNGLF